MLQKKYEIDREFNNLLQMTPEMDSEMAEIDKLLSDKKLFELILADLSKRYPLSTKTGRNSTKRRSDIKNASSQTPPVPQL